MGQGKIVQHTLGKKTFQGKAFDNFLDKRPFQVIYTGKYLNKSFHDNYLFHLLKKLNSFFYKNIFYENIKAEICEILKMF